MTERKEFWVKIIRRCQDLDQIYFPGEKIHVDNGGYKEKESDYYYNGIYKIDKHWCKKIRR